LLAASAWGTICFFWMGLLVYRTVSVRSMFHSPISLGIGLYLALLAGPLAAGAFGYVASLQTPTFEPQRRKLFLIAAHAGGFVVAMLLGAVVSQRVSVNVTPMVDMSQSPFNPPASFNNAAPFDLKSVPFPPGSMPAFPKGAARIPGGMPAMPKGGPTWPNGQPVFPTGPKAKSHRTPSVPANDNDPSGETDASSAASSPAAASPTTTPPAADATPDDAPSAPKATRPTIPIADALAARARSNKEAEVAKLEKKQADSEQARQQLKQFQVLQASAQIEKRGSRKQWVRVVVVKNDTDQVVSHAYFRGTLQSAGRDTPVLTDTFNHKVKGGIQPGEQAEWKIHPSKSSAWKGLEESADMTYTVEVVRLDGANGKPVFKNDFTADDQRRLDAIKKDLAESK
jgi:hypothetical protein